LFITDPLLCIPFLFSPPSKTFITFLSVYPLHKNDKNSLLSEAVKITTNSK
jgi:hypothetical protein